MMPRRHHPLARSLVVAILSLLIARPAGVLGGTSGSSGGVTIRVRMMDGAVKRLQASSVDTIEDIMGRLGMSVADGDSLSTEAGGGSAEPSTSVADLGIKHGDFLYSKNDEVKQVAASAKADALRRMKSAVHHGEAQGDKFVPFPEHQRPPPPRASKRVRNWQDIEAMQAQTFTLKPQKASNVKKISVEQRAMDEFVGYLKQQGQDGKICHRCALLFGKVNSSSKEIKVQAMFEPPQEGGKDTSTYDASALMEAATAATKREHFMGAGDVVTAAAMQLWAMRDLDLGLEAGALMATVTLPVNQTNGEVATEAFSLSNQTIQMFSEGIFPEVQPSPTSDK
ncbi:unnamed protein product, partial [Choristocarpus tenellus]